MLTGLPPTRLIRAVLPRSAARCRTFASEFAPGFALAAPLLAIAALLVVALLGVTESARAATAFYHSAGDDGMPPAGAGSIDEGGSRSVYLYVDGGGLASATGAACNDGAGDEVCGYELRLGAQGGLTLTGFNPDAGSDLVFNLGSGEIVLNGLTTVGTTPGPKRIGELIVNATVGGSVELTEAEVIGADLESELIAPATLVTVPEPGLVASIGAGLLLLGALQQWRAGR
jgi:hypothetical protein